MPPNLVIKLTQINALPAIGYIRCLDRKKYEAAKTLRLGPSPMLREHSRFVRNHSCFGMETTKYLTKLLGYYLLQEKTVCDLVRF